MIEVVESFDSGFNCAKSQVTFLFLEVDLGELDSIMICSRCHSSRQALIIFNGALVLYS